MYQQATYVYGSGDISKTGEWKFRNYVVSPALHFNLSLSNLYSYAGIVNDKYSIYYNANGVSGAPALQTKTYGTILTLSNIKPTITGYTFKGWSTDSTAKSKTVTKDLKAFNLNAIKNGDGQLTYSSSNKKIVMC